MKRYAFDSRKLDERVLYAPFSKVKIFIVSTVAILTLLSEIKIKGNID